MNFDDIKFIGLRAGVRYWEDSDVNGKEDISLTEVKVDTTPRMPFAFPTFEETNIAPFGKYEWRITIEKESGRILDWPYGTTASVSYKTCDDNTIFLYGEDMNIINKYETYVPSFLSIDGAGYGDYIYLTIDECGFIKNFNFTEDDVDDLERNSF